MGEKEGAGAAAALPLSRNHFLSHVTLGERVLGVGGQGLQIWFGSCATKKVSQGRDVSNRDAVTTKTRLRHRVTGKTLGSTQQPQDMGAMEVPTLPARAWSHTEGRSPAQVCPSSEPGFFPPRH